MNVSLTPELENLIEQKVKTGMYNSASEVIRAGLRLLQEHEEIKYLSLEDLRHEVRKGIEQINQGKIVDGDEVFKELRERNLNLQKAKTKKK
jgi:antitoxin ParD1/3/4